MLFLTSLVFAAALLLSFLAACNGALVAIHKVDVRGHLYTNSALGAILWGVFYYLTH